MTGPSPRRNRRSCAPSWKKGTARAGREEQQTLRLSDFVRHDELYQNYPQLRQAALRFADLPEGTHGSYNTGTNTITLNNSLRSSPEDTLVHEIQHAIQNAEGFSGGSSPEYWRTPREAAIRPEYRGRIQETRERLRKLKTGSVKSGRTTPST